MTKTPASWHATTLRTKLTFPKDPKRPNVEFQLPCLITQGEQPNQAHILYHERRIMAEDEDQLTDTLFLAFNPDPEGKYQDWDTAKEAKEKSSMRSSTSSWTNPAETAATTTCPST